MKITEESFHRCKAKAVPLSQVVTGTVYFLFTVFPEYNVIYRRSQPDDNFKYYLNNWYYLEVV